MRMKRTLLSITPLFSALGLAGILGCQVSLLAQPAPSPSTTSASDNSSLPAFISPTSPLAQVIHLVQADVEENIILSYVSNSSSTFNLDSDKIIYLSDVGVPGLITTTMMQRDQVLQQQMATAQPAPAPLQPTPPPLTPDTDATDTAATDTATAPPPADSGPVTINYFYTSLAPYGAWVDVAGYGRCWRPTTSVYNQGWQPYCDRGAWVYTDGGWYWESEYSWGVTFHYGRWFRDRNLGWCWWPDTVWAPSWVTWRYSEDVCGWAPLPPYTVYQPGIGFAFQGNGISVGFDFGLAPDCFTFVPTGRFGDPHPRRWRCAPDQVNRIYTHTTIINNLSYNHTTVVNGGLPPQHFNSAGGAPIRQTSWHDVHVPPSFTQHPASLQPHYPASPAGQNWNHNYVNNRPNAFRPGQNNASAPSGSYPVVTDRSHPSQPWSANPASSQPAVRNYGNNYNNNQPLILTGNRPHNQTGTSAGNPAPAWPNNNYNQPVNPAVSRPYNQTAAPTETAAPPRFNNNPPEPEVRSFVPARPVAPETPSPRTEAPAQHYSPPASSTTQPSSQSSSPSPQRQYNGH